MVRKAFLAIAAIGLVSVTALATTPALAGPKHENWGHAKKGHHHHAYKHVHGHDRPMPVYVAPGYYYHPAPVVYAPPPSITVIFPLSW
jgi:hypothetical protein